MNELPDLPNLLYQWYGAGLVVGIIYCVFTLPALILFIEEKSGTKIREYASYLPIQALQASAMAVIISWALEVGLRFLMPDLNTRAGEASNLSVYVLIFTAGVLSSSYPITFIISGVWDAFVNTMRWIFKGEAVKVEVTEVVEMEEEAEETE